MNVKSNSIITRNRMVYTVLFLLFGISLSFSQDIMVSRNSVLMGSQFSFTVVAKDSAEANFYIESAIEEVERIENLISEWREETQISLVNKNAGIKPIKVDGEVFELTKRAIYYSEMSQGAFDISIAALDKLWRFDGSMEALPNAEQLKNSVRNVGYQNIILDSINSTIFLKNKGMKIGFGSIGKGYAADRARFVLRGLGAKSGVVNASGDIATWGKPTDNAFWKIGVKNPFKKRKSAKILNLNEGAVATSGSYEKFAEVDNKRYSHIINPKTGMPASGLTSVTIYGSSCEFSNALSTSVMVLGRKKGKFLLKKFPNYSFFIISDTGKIVQ